MYGAWCNSNRCHSPFLSGLAGSFSFFAFFTRNTMNRLFLSPIASVASLFVIDLSFAVNVTFCDPLLSPAVMTIEVASNVFCSAPRTYVLQPPHVTPVISSVYVVSSPLAVATASARIPNVAKISFFITILYMWLVNYLPFFWVPNWRWEWFRVLCMLNFRSPFLLRSTSPTCYS